MTSLYNGRYKGCKGAGRDREWQEEGRKGTGNSNIGKKEREGREHEREKKGTGRMQLGRGHQVERKGHGGKKLGRKGKGKRPEM